MTLQQLRHVAIGAVRSEIRHMGIDPKNVDAVSAYDTLDDMTRREPNKLFAEWYNRATDNQYRLFLREWRKRQ